MLLIIHYSLLLNLNSPHIRNNLRMSSCRSRVLLPLNRFLVNQLIQLRHFSRKNLPLLIRPLKIHPLRSKLLTLPNHIKNRRQAVSVRLSNSVVRIDLQAQVQILQRLLNLIQGYLAPRPLINRQWALLHRICVRKSLCRVFIRASGHQQIPRVHMNQRVLRLNHDQLLKIQKRQRCVP